MEKTTSIKLTDKEIDLIWLALWKLPYEQVFQLIYKISNQYKEAQEAQEAQE